MGHVRTVFDNELRIPTSFLGHPLSHRGIHHHGAVPSSTLTNIKTPTGNTSKIETSVFSFAGFDWIIILYPLGVKEAHGKYVTHVTHMIIMYIFSKNNLCYNKY